MHILVSRQARNLLDETTLRCRLVHSLELEFDKLLHKLAALLTMPMHICSHKPSHKVQFNTMAST